MNDNVKDFKRKPDQMDLFKLYSDEIWEAVKKYQALGLSEPLLRTGPHDVAFELQMGSPAFINDGDEPA
jgi:hypothetical protein